ncbi:hypothetical protein GLOIN_2v55951 [Rhizophagus clarus]|uniref:Uncharacterized protein n=1 Tax=Rhizophagus clarus TaxID=94130 RepID=A0A8H3QPC9_9GLOM|nr:hypothetical protein GLOIN_2v55951 [Rhizophagus clarus]
MRCHNKTIQRQPSKEIFNVPIANNTVIDDVCFEFDSLTVANFKDILFKRREVRGITSMDIWKVKIGFNEINNFFSEDEIKNHDKNSLFDNVLDVIKQQPVLRPVPKNVIKHPSNLELPVIERSSLYVRKAYVELYDLIAKYGSVKAPNLKHKFLLTGTSGVGKSCFMIYLLIRIMREQDSTAVIYQHSVSNVFYCFENFDVKTGDYEEFSYLFESSKTCGEKKAVLEKTLKCVEDAFRSVKNFNDLVRCFAEDVEFIKFSNRLIHRWSSSGYDKYHLKWASAYVLSKVQEKLEEQSWKDLLDKIPKMLRNHLSACRIMFEAYGIHLSETEIKNLKQEIYKAVVSLMS